MTRMRPWEEGLAIFSVAKGVRASSSLYAGREGGRFDLGDEARMDLQRERNAGRPPVRNARSARTREALRRAFLQLLEMAPLEEVTIRNVTAEADVSYATFFRHYADKDALLDDVAAEEISRLLAMTLPLLFSVDSRASSRALCAYVREHRAIWTVLLTGGASSVLKKEFIRQAREVAARSGERDSRIPNDLRVVFCVSGTLEILAWWLEHGDDISIDRMAEIQDMLGVAPHVRPGPEEAVAVGELTDPRSRMTDLV
ncbi:TetR/AcrR family transcriptional regulator [Sphingobium yanoikuyae]